MVTFTRQSSILESQRRSEGVRGQPPSSGRRPGRRIHQLIHWCGDVWKRTGEFQLKRKNTGNSHRDIVSHTLSFKKPFGFRTMSEDHPGKLASQKLQRLSINRFG